MSKYYAVHNEDVHGRLSVKAEYISHILRYGSCYLIHEVSREDSVVQSLRGICIVVMKDTEVSFIKIRIRCGQELNEHEI